MKTEVGDLFNGEEVLEVVDKGAFYELTIQGADDDGEEVPATI